MNQNLMELERALSHIRLSLDERAEEMKQEYESTLTLLEAEFLGALMSADWSEFDRFVNDFKTQSPIVKYEKRCGFAVDFDRHTQIRDRIKTAINQLKAEGVTVAELIEACRNELQLLHLEDDASAEVLTGPGAGSSSQTTN
jgi:hypothetical protein